MRIVFTCPSFKIGGFSTSALNLASEFQKEGHSISCIITDPLGEMAQEFVDKFDHIKVIKRQFETRSGYIRKLILAIDELIPDVVINNAVPFVQAAFPYLAERIIRISVVHSLNEDELQIGCANVDYVDAVVAVAQNITDACLKRVNSHKLFTIPVGVPIGPVERVVRSSKEPIRLAYAGRITLMTKNIGLVEDVLHLLWEKKISFEMSFVGDGPYTQDLKNNIRRTPYASCVRFYGSVSPGEVRRILNTTDITLLTSTSEGTPHVLLEALSVGSVPVASYLPGSTDKIVEHGVSGFLCKELLPEDFVKHISILANDTNLLSMFSRNAVNAVVEKYSISIIAKKYIDIISAGAQHKNRKNGLHSGQFLLSDVALGKHCHSFPRHLLRKLGDIQRRVMKGIRYIPNYEIQRIIATKNRIPGQDGL